MKISASKYFNVGQVMLALALLTSLFLLPNYFFSLDQGGVSNYGTESKTQILFSIGFGVAAFLTFLASKNLTKSAQSSRVLKINLIILSVLYVLLLISTYPYKINDLYRSIHEYIAMALFIFMIFFVTWIRCKKDKDNPFIKRMFWVFLAGIVVAGLTLFGFIHLLFTAQIISGMAFALIVSNALKN